MDKETEARLRSMELRLERLERLSYEAYGDIRRVAEYAYSNVRFEVDPETIKRIPGMRPLSDRDALSVGMAMDDLVALKIKMKHLAKRCRLDALGIAKLLADERKRRPPRPDRMGESRESEAA